MHYVYVNVKFCFVAHFSFAIVESDSRLYFLLFYPVFDCMSPGIRMTILYIDR